MKKILLASVAGAGLLASCGNTAVTSNGAYVTVTGIKTEYRTQDGRYIACDNVYQDNNQKAAATQVAVYFRAGGDISSLTVDLRGNTDSTNDNYYTGTFTGSLLNNLGSDNYKVIFDAQPGDKLLPQGIDVNPVQRNIKVVRAENRAGGRSDTGFYAALTLNTPGESEVASTRPLDPTRPDKGIIPAYSNCYVQNVTDETL